MRRACTTPVACSVGMEHDENVIAAAMLAVSDRVRRAAEDAAGRAGGGAAALTALYGWGNGASIESLAAGLELSHSRAVRIIDGLVADGLVVRRADARNRRRVLVHLTSAGCTTCREMLDAREQALRRALAALDDDQRATLGALAEILVEDAVADRNGSRVICRFCDTEACGHRDDRCPATRKADRLDGRPA
jgi:DNA-binding MarR family transcriptional regulator